MASTSEDKRDDAALRRGQNAGGGRRSFAPSNHYGGMRSGTYCECVVDPTTGRQFCVCSGAVASDMGFEDNKSDYIIHPATRMASPYERAAIKRRQRMIAGSHA